MPSMLIVDDNPADIDLLRLALFEVDATLQIFAVESVVQACAFMSKQGGFSQMPSPDLVLMDISMPVISELHALQLIRDTPSWSCVPVVIWSSSRREEDRYVARKLLRAVEYVVKPGDWEGLLVVAKRLTERLNGSAGEAAS